MADSDDDDAFLPPGFKQRMVQPDPYLDALEAELKADLLEGHQCLSEMSPTNQSSTIDPFVSSSSQSTFGAVASERLAERIQELEKENERLGLSLTLDLQESNRKISDLQQENEKLSSVASERDTLRAELSRLETEMCNPPKMVRTSSEDLSMQDQLSELQNQIDVLKNDLECALDRASEADDKLILVVSEVENAVAARNAAEAALLVSEQQNTNLRQTLDDKRSNLRGTIRGLHRKIGKLEGERDALQDVIDEHLPIASLKASVDSTGSDRNDASYNFRTDEHILLMETRIKQHESTIDEKDSMIKDLEQQLQMATKKTSEARTKTRCLQRRIGVVEMELEAAQETNLDGQAELHSIIQKYIDEIESLENRLHSQQQGEDECFELQVLQSQVSKLEAHAVDSQAIISSLRDDKKVLQGELETITIASESWDKKEVALRAQLRELLDRNERVRDELGREIENQKAQHQLAISSLEHETSQLTEQLSSKDLILVSLKRRIDELQVDLEKSELDKESVVHELVLVEKKHKCVMAQSASTACQAMNDVNRMVGRKLRELYGVNEKLQDTLTEQHDDLLSTRAVLQSKVSEIEELTSTLRSTREERDTHLTAVRQAQSMLQETEHRLLRDISIKSAEITRLTAVISEHEHSPCSPEDLQRTELEMSSIVVEHLCGIQRSKKRNDLLEEGEAELKEQILELKSQINQLKVPTDLEDPAKIPASTKGEVSTMELVDMFRLCKTHFEKKECASRHPSKQSTISHVASSRPDPNESVCSYDSFLRDLSTRQPPSSAFHPIVMESERARLPYPQPILGTAVARKQSAKKESPSDTLFLETIQSNMSAFRSVNRQGTDDKNSRASDLPSSAQMKETIVCENNTSFSSIESSVASTLGTPGSKGSTAIEKRLHQPSSNAARIQRTKKKRTGSAVSSRLSKPTASSMRKRNQDKLPPREISISRRSSLQAPSFSAISRAKASDQPRTSQLPAQKRKSCLPQKPKNRLHGIVPREKRGQSSVLRVETVTRKSTKLPGPKSGLLNPKRSECCSVSGSTPRRDMLTKKFSDLTNASATPLLSATRKMKSSTSSKLLPPSRERVSVISSPCSLPRKSSLPSSANTSFETPGRQKETFDAPFSPETPLITPVKMANNDTVSSTVSAAGIEEARSRSCTAIQKRFRSWSMRRSTATIFAKLVRGWLCRRRFIAFRRAVVQVQSFWRSRVDRKAWLLSKRSAAIIQTAIKEHLRRSILLESSARLLQRVAKEYLFYKTARCQQQLRVSSVTRLQTQWRRFQEARRFISCKNAATTVQKTWRAWLARTAFSASVQRRLSHACIKVQALFRRKLIPRSSTMVHSVITIQRNWRMCDCRAKFHKRIQLSEMERASENARLIQTKWRAASNREHFMKTIRMCCVIQRWVRTRWEIRKTAAALTIQSMWRMTSARRSLAENLSAARVVQSTFRSFAVRKPKMGVRVSLMKYAVSIQSFWRMTIQRRAFGTFLRRVIQLQKFIRMTLGVMHKREALSAATLIQSKWIGSRTKLEYKKMLWSCAVIQKCARKALIKARAHRNEEVAVVRMQAMFRGYAQRSSSFHATALAVALQTLLRGHSARARFLRLKTSLWLAIRIQSRWRMKKQRGKFLLALSMVVAIQRLARISLCRRKSQHRAATIIQSSWLSHTMRKEERNKIRKSVVLQKWYREILETRYSHSAATSVQASWRMASQRKSYKETLQATLMLQSVLRSHLARCHVAFFRETITQCATMIQSVWRMKKARLQYQRTVCRILLVQSWVRTRLQRMKEASAATAIRSCWLAFISQRALRTKIQKCHVLQSWARGMLRERYQLSILNASTCIQASWRMYSVQKRQKYFQSAAIKLQSCVRKFLARLDVLHLKDAMCQSAVAIQSSWRMRRCRRTLERTLFYVVQIQNFVRSSLKTSETKRVAANIIQAQWSVWVCRQHYRRLINLNRKKTSAAICIQTSWRMVCSRRAYKIVATGIVALQSILRKRVAQKQFDAVRCLIRSTVVVQSAWRMTTSRRKFVLLKSSVVSVQMASRATSGRRTASAVAIHQADPPVSRSLRTRKRKADHSEQTTARQVLGGLTEGAASRPSRRTRTSENIIHDTSRSTAKYAVEQNNENSVAEVGGERVERSTRSRVIASRRETIQDEVESMKVVDLRAELSSLGVESKEFRKLRKAQLVELVVDHRLGATNV